LLCPFSLSFSPADPLRTHRIPTLKDLEDTGVPADEIDIVHTLFSVVESRSPAKLKALLISAGRTKKWLGTVLRTETEGKEDEGGVAAAENGTGSSNGEEEEEEEEDNNSDEDGAGVIVDDEDDIDEEDDEDNGFVVDNDEEKQFSNGEEELNQKVHLPLSPPLHLLPPPPLLLCTDLYPCFPFPFCLTE
jgi:hypothetical protein